LVLGKKLLGVASEMPVTFEVVVHLGTLLATLIVFWRPVWEILRFLGRAATGKATRPLWADPSCRLLVLLVLANIPAGVVGVLFNDFLESLFSNALLVAVALCVTGTALLATRWSRVKHEGMENVSVGPGLIVGVAQAIAITPGISRSGATIATGLLCGMDREAAARFSFLLSMPAIAGAAVLKARDIAAAGAQIGWAPLVMGFIASFAVGLIALTILLALVRRGRLHWFGYYCWLIGLAAIVAFSLGFLRG
jgi:undecaprenyl-diphosphatase